MARLEMLFLALLASHPGTSTLSVQTRHHLFLAMEYVPRGDCMTLLADLGRVPERVARAVVLEVAMAIHHLHAHKVRALSRTLSGPI